MSCLDSIKHKCYLTMIRHRYDLHLTHDLSIANRTSVPVWTTSPCISYHIYHETFCQCFTSSTFCLVWFQGENWQGTMFFWSIKTMDCTFIMNSYNFLLPRTLWLPLEGMPLTLYNPKEKWTLEFEEPIKKYFCEKFW